jgi:hypothetical protein
MRLIIRRLRIVMRLHHPRAKPLLPPLHPRSVIAVRIHQVRPLTPHSRAASGNSNNTCTSKHALSPTGDRSANNVLKLRILELEKEALVAAQASETLARKLAEAKEVAREKDVEMERVKQDFTDRQNSLRASLGAQVSELEQKNYELTHQLQAAKAHSLAKDSSYREMVAAGGKLPDANHLEPGELARIQNELKNTDHLIKEMNKDNEKLHMELKICEAKYKNQIHQAVEEQKQLRFELHAKGEEITRLTNAQNSILDPLAKDKINELTVAMNQLREKHHQEVSNLKYELDKLRSVKLELAVRKEDASAMGRDSLRLTLEALQEKYNALKVAKETEVRELHTKLVWYIENQQLITRYEEDLARARKEIEQLKDENLVMNHLIPAGTRMDGSGKEVKLKPRPIDTKRIKDLESKVAELSDIIKKKSALPASGAQGQASSIAGMIAAIKPTMEEHELIVTLRGKLTDAEVALQRKDEETMARLRSLRQETDQMKLLYEKRMTKLQKDLTDTQKRIPLTGRNKLNRITELERTIEELRRFYGDKVKKQASLIIRVRRGEKVDEGEVKEMEADAGEEDTQQQHNVSTRNDPPESKEPAAVVPSHDSLPLPGPRFPVHVQTGSIDADFPRSPLRGQVQPHPHPLAPADPSTRDFLLFKQTLQEHHDQDLHLITTRYESQLENAKFQWENQIQLIRATHDADMKLQQSLLQQAQDEVTRIRQALANEMQQRSSMQERCLQLESELQQARNQPAYCNYKDLEHKIDAMSQAWQQREKEYAVSWRAVPCDDSPSLLVVLLLSHSLFLPIDVRSLLCRMPLRSLLPILSRSALCVTTSFVTSMINSRPRRCDSTS